MTTVIERWNNHQRSIAARRQIRPRITVIERWNAYQANIAGRQLLTGLASILLAMAS